MDALEIFLQAQEKPSVTVYYGNQGAYGISHISICGCNTKEKFEDWTKKSCNDAMKSFADDIENKISFPQRITHLLMSQKRIEKALENYHSGLIFDECGDLIDPTQEDILVNRSVLISHEGAYNPDKELIGDSLDIHLEKYLAILQNYGIQFLEYLRKMESLLSANPSFGTSIDISSKEKKIMSKIIWKKTKTDLVELISVLVASGALYKDEHTPITKKDAYVFFAEMFSVDLAQADSLLSRAYGRKKEDGVPFLKLLHDKFLETKAKKDK